jgi:tRNA-dihydrouridine synthase
MQEIQTQVVPVVLPQTTPTFQVGNIPIYGDAILAPMDGFSDWPFRSICRGLGSAMSYNEFTRAEFIVNAYKHI